MNFQSHVPNILPLIPLNNELVEHSAMNTEMGWHYNVIKVINRGIFGVPSAKKSAILGLVELLESQNPTPDPTLNLEKVSQ